MIRTIFFIVCLIVIELIKCHDISSMFLTANTLYSKGLLAEACHYYKEVLKYEPSNADANCNLGSVYLDMDDPINAELYYRNTLSIDDKHQGALFNLASLLQDKNSIQQNKDELNEARDLYERLLVIEPNSIDALANLGALFHRSSNYSLAVLTYKKAIDTILIDNDSNNDENNQVLSSLYEHYGRAVLRIADNKKLLNDSSVDSLILEAQQLLNNSLHYNSNNSIAKHMLMSILSDNCTNDNYQASDDYITRLFDDFSTSFESSLEKLEYHAPSLLSKAIADQNKLRYSLLIDLGCGTGLFGAMISNYSNIKIDHCLGVDLSSKMLKLAAEKQVNSKRIYNNLYAGPMTQFITALAKYRYNGVLKIDDYNSDIVDVDDIVHNGFDKQFLNGNKQLLNEYPLLVVAADVFVYVGDLDSVFESFFELKKKDDIFAFTTEALSEDNDNKSFKLQANGRYAHKKSYIDKLIEKYQFQIVTYEAVILRKELGNNVHGHLYLFSCKN